VLRKRPNHAQIEALYRQYGPALLLYASAITGERSRAQDAVHHVFLRLLDHTDIRQALDPKAYLFASVRNAALNDAKARRREIANAALRYWSAFAEMQDSAIYR